MSWMLSCIGCGSKKLAEKEETKILDFQHYSLTAVPPYVFECERFLEELYLDFNQISELPRELFLCNELQILSLSDNDLHNIPPAISSLSSLISLDLSKNGISDIPDNIKSCKKLHSVNASTNPLCRLPEGFTQLVSLKELSLSDTFLEYLPANFGRLTGLEVLDLRENQLNTLPRSMTRLTALKRLDLGQNEFTELPEVVGHLISLTDLWIDNNRIKRIPSEIGNLEKLSFLDASKNRISEIDSQIGSCKSLTHLYLTRNELEELPDSLSQCTKLSILHIDDNHVGHLPENFGALDRLVELKSSQNELSDLPSSVGLLRNLQFLHVDENLLSTLPSEIGSCVSLIVITASHNHIGELPAEMGSLPCLKVLNLCGNIIQSLPVSFSKLQLRALWLSENQAKPSVPLQCTNNTQGQKVLTCFMLPQTQIQNAAAPERDDDDKPLTEAEIEARRARSMIHFAADGDLKPSGRLTRVPTPYPKELRALAKHTKNILALKKEKEKEAPVPSTEANNSPAVKELEKSNPPSEKPSSLVTLKSSASTVKVASNVASESAIKSSQVEEESLPESVNNILPESKRITNSFEEKHSNSVCQNEPPPSAISQPENQATSLGKVIGRREMLAKESAMKISNYSLGENVSSPQNLRQPYIIKPTEASPPYHVSSETQNIEANGDPSSSLRPASIAVTELSSVPNVKRDNYPQRPGSLALEGMIPPWQNQRPGSLAAPINTVGIPMVSPTKRASSQSALHGMLTKNSPFGDHWKSYDAPTRIVMKENLVPQVLVEKQEEIAEQVNETDLEVSRVEGLTDSAPLSVTEVEALNEKNLVHNQEKDETTSEVKLASTISRVTEKDYENIISPPFKDDHPVRSEKVEGDSKTENTPISSSISYQSPSDENYNHYHNEKDDEKSAKCPSFIAWSPSTTKIPKVSQVSAAAKASQITPPKVLTSEKTSLSKISSTSSGTGIQPPSYSSHISSPKSFIVSPGSPPILYSSDSPSPSSSQMSPITTTSFSKIQPPSYSSSIPSLKSPILSGSLTSYSPKSPASPSGISGIPPPTYSSSTSTPSPKSSITSPSGIQPPSYSSSVPSSKPSVEKVKSNIPTLTSPVYKKEFHSDLRSPDDHSRGKTPPKDNHSSRTPPKEISPPSKEAVSPKGSSRIPLISSHSQEGDTKELSGAPDLTRSPSQTDRESFIPVKKGDVPQPKINPALSPAEKPINQTGIPILSPSENPMDRSSSRIPTFSNSSLRNKKSGIPSLSDKGGKGSVVKKGD